MNQINYRYKFFQKSRENLAFEINQLRIKNDEIDRYSNGLKKMRIIYKTIFSILLLLLWLLILTYSSEINGQINPQDISEMVFFVESEEIDLNSHVAYCETEFCLNHTNTENAIIAEQYCDISASCEEGCVRRWQDQSNYIPNNGFNPPEYIRGRNFGQDDSEKPCFVSNCLNGRPCVRGGAPYGDFSQDKYLELQISDFINLPSDFSIFLLVKPIDQSISGNWYYFGQSSHFLRHNVSTNNLQLRVPGNFVTTISSNNSIVIDAWQLIEIHRSSIGKISVFINGEDKSLSNSIILNGNFQIGYLMSNFKTTGQYDQTAMYGDIASFLVYNREISSSERNDIRQYYETNYLGETLSLDVIKKEQLKVSFRDGSVHIQNPNFLHINSLSILNLLGEQLFEEVIKSSDTYQKFHLQKLPKGIYLVKVKTSFNSTNFTYKVINH